MTCSDPAPVDRTRACRDRSDPMRSARSHSERLPDGTVVVSAAPGALSTAVAAATLAVPLRTVTGTTVLAAPLVAAAWAVTVRQAARRRGVNVRTEPVATADFVGVTVEAAGAERAALSRLPDWFSPTAWPGTAAARRGRDRALVQPGGEGRRSDPVRRALFGTAHRYGIGHEERIRFLRACTPGVIAAAMAELAGVPPVLALSAADPAEVRRCAQRLAAAREATPAGPAPPEEDWPAPPPPAARSAAGGGRSGYLAGTGGVALGSSEKYAVHVAWALLGGREGELDRRLRKERGLTYALAAFSRELADGGYGLIYAVCRASAREEVARQVDEALDLLGAVEPAPAALATARERLIIQQLRATQTARGFTQRMCGYEIAGLAADGVSAYPDHLAQVSGADVVRVAARFLARDRRVDLSSA